MNPVIVPCMCVFYGSNPVSIPLFPPGLHYRTPDLGSVAPNLGLEKINRARHGSAQASGPHGTSPSACMHKRTTCVSPVHTEVHTGRVTRAWPGSVGSVRQYVNCHALLFCLDRLDRRSMAPHHTSWIDAPHSWLSSCMHATSSPNTFSYMVSWP
jgi:hypothetical protein